MPSKENAYNETIAFLGGRGYKKNTIILYLINGTFMKGVRGSKLFVSCIIQKKFHLGNSTTFEQMVTQRHLKSILEHIWTTMIIGTRPTHPPPETFQSS